MQSEKVRKQYGLWESPISPVSLARGLGLSDVAWNHDGTLLWREWRSDRGVLVVQPPDGQAARDLNSDFSVRAGVGYGGGDFTVGHGQVYFVEAKSGRIYRQALESGTAKSVTPGFGSAASPSLSPDGRYLLYVHTYERHDSIGIVDSQGEFWPQKLISGEDFYMQPCWHPNGGRIAFVAWNHPNMPWDGTLLKLGTMHFEGDRPLLGDVVTIAGGDEISIFQPEFSPDGRYLAYVADQTGWWHIYLYDLETGEHRPLTGGEAEHGNPAWVQGMRTFGFGPTGKEMFFIRSQDGFKGLWKADVDSGQQERIAVGAEYTWIDQIAAAPHADEVALLASGGRLPTRVITTGDSGGTHIWKRSTSEDLSPDTYALPQTLTWSGMDGDEVFGMYYEPQNEGHEGVGLPPLMILVHGGPTGQRGASFDAGAQFFASRGYAVLQVNYRGSTGYGRAYRDKLKGSWGIYDVQDAVSGAKYLVEDEQVDGSKLVIMGGSAGGFTVLKALEDYPGFFKAGICLYGVANHFTLAADTHKFEERYLDTMLGPLPEASDLYRERSPLFFADKIQDAIAVFQGEDDKVVPRAQSDEIVAALKRTGVPHEYHLYPGEGHGFRKTETIEKFYTTVLKFLRQYVIFA
jgi:dipeptidyl aminopeptidase/acylaminoacyl peptidase